MTARRWKRYRDCHALNVTYTFELCAGRIYPNPDGGFIVEPSMLPGTTAKTLAEAKRIIEATEAARLANGTTPGGTGEKE